MPGWCTWAPQSDTSYGRHLHTLHVTNKCWETAAKYGTMKSTAFNLVNHHLDSYERPGPGIVLSSHLYCYPSTVNSTLVPSACVNLRFDSCTDF